MGYLELFLLALGLSMDAFAVAICKGLAMTRATLGKAAIVGLWFGGFQAGMPVLGYFLGVQFRDQIISIDHWVAFILLFLIGMNMIRESFSHDEEKTDAGLGFRNMLVMAIATSIDALAVGVTFAFLEVNIWGAVSMIGITTFLLAILGVKIGSVFGARYKARAEFAGGLILIILGTKILLEHLGIITF